MDTLENIGYLSGGSRLRRIYENMQIHGDKVYREANINFKSSWFPVYYTLTKKDKQTIMEIANQIAFSHITVKNILRELEDNHLVKIDKSKTDKRSKLVSLTEEGKKLLTQVEPLWEGFSQVIKEIFKAGHDDFIQILTKIDNALESEPFDKRVSKVLKNLVFIEKAKSKDFKSIGKLMAQVYSRLDGFPKPEEQPEYYKLLLNVGDFAKMPATEIYAAFSNEKKLLGAVVFFGNMQYYSSGGTANLEKDAAGFRLLAVNENERGKGIGKKLTLKCIERAKELKVSQVIIHTTKAMKPAWEMYEKMGFKRSVDLDFIQGNLQVFGFRLIFKTT